MALSKEWYDAEFIDSEKETLHRAPSIEYSFYNAVKTGDMDFVIKNCKEDAFIHLEGTGVLSRNPLNNIKYHFVVTTAMVTRYCIDGGLEPEQAYRLSDFYILKMDSCTTVRQVADLHHEMTKDFTGKMILQKKASILSKPVTQCVDYIYSHIKERITIADLAAYTGLSESYLSRVFKQNLGVSISDYIREKKIEKVNNEDEFRLPENSDYLAVIQKVSINKNMFKTFEKLEVEVTYDVYDNHMEDLQVGVAFYSLDRKIYVFGPNTNLDKISVPQKQGRHVVKYIVPELMLMGGDYTVDVGIFNSGGIVNLDYKNNCEGFSVANEYFSEGMFYLKHEWQIGE